MKKIITAIFLFTIGSQVLLGQVPNNFNYQGVLRNASGELIKNSSITLQISLLEGSSTATASYVERHSVTSNDFGQFAIMIGDGDVQSGTFSAINWAGGLVFLKTEVDETGGSSFTELSTVQLITVPYAMYANSAGNLGDNNIYSAGSDTLFVVKDHDGNVVFAVFPDGAEVFVNENAKGKVGGFAVSGRNPSKAGEIDIMKVTLDSTRIYVSDTIGSKGKVGGFAVSGRNPSKGIAQEYLVVTGDSTRIYVNDTSTVKGKVGGFAVSGRNPSKGLVNDYLQVTKDSTRIYVTESSNKAKVGGFAVSGRSPSKGNTQDYFNITGNSAAEIVNNEARVMWYPQKAALLAGEVHVGSSDSVGTNSMAMGYRSVSMGDYSQAMGYKALASGTYSTAIGYQAVTDSANSYAFGNNTYTGGINSYALGDSAKALGENAYAIGAGASALGNYSFAIGSNGVLIVDEITYQLGAASAKGDFSYSIGNSISNAKGGVAMGLGNTVNGDYSLAMGFLCSTEGEMSTAIGNHTKAVNNHSTALGVYTTALGTGSTSMGYSTVAKSYLETVIGTFNDTIYSEQTGGWVDTDPIFTIGNGIDGDNLNNAFMVLKNGNTGIGGYPGNTGGNVLAVNKGEVPTDTIPEGVLLFAQDVNASTELRVMDGGGNITTLSPHNFGLVKKSEPMAWSFYSENKKLGYQINVDMLKAIRTIEQLSGEKLVYMKDLAAKELIEQNNNNESLVELVKKLQIQITQLEKENEELKQKLNEIIELLSGE